MEFAHVPVLLEKAIESLAVRADGVYVDGTAGGGGHSREIAKRLTTGRLICLDRDPDAVEVLKERMAGFSCVTVVEGNFADLGSILDGLGIDKVDGVLLDIGVSSFQLDKAERGFSFHFDAPLDMRMSKKGKSAYEIINSASFEELVHIISAYGEERYARSIARAIERERKAAPIESTLQLAEIIKNAVPFSARRDGHPARRTFQAIRIAVNDELENLKLGIDEAFSRLGHRGRLSVITFHSLEDRIVKRAFSELTKGCVCPPGFPKCVCGKEPLGKLITKKPEEPGMEEIETNPRSRSAKLRTIEKY